MMDGVEARRARAALAEGAERAGARAHFRAMGIDAPRSAYFATRRMKVKPSLPLMVVTMTLTRGSATPLKVSPTKEGSTEE